MKIFRRIFPLALVLVIVGGLLALLTPATTAGLTGCPKYMDKINIYPCIQMGCQPTICSGGRVLALWGCDDAGGCAYCVTDDFCTQ